MSHGGTTPAPQTVDQPALEGKGGHDVRFPYAFQDTETSHIKNDSPWGYHFFGLLDLNSPMEADRKLHLRGLHERLGRGRFELMDLHQTWS